jgi:pimeloyl-ACP methyl ester carboxylesterase
MSSVPEPVLYVHGLFMNGAEALLLRRRLAARGFELTPFRYRTTKEPIDEVVVRLDRMVASKRAERLHFVGHSYGGLVLLRYFERDRGAPPGRVVLLGTPAVGSAAAIGAARHPWIASVLGSAGEELCAQGGRRWSAGRELGVLAGTHALGLGRFLAGFAEPSDGTVAVSETRLAGASDHRAVPASHMGLLASPEVARETAHFLRHGRFSGAE